MPPDAELVHGWLVKARRDLVTGRRAIDGDPPIADMAAYHAQQTVEKSLKALLIWRDIEPPRTHLIALLLGLCHGVIPELDAMARSCSWLTTFAVDSRYPDSDAEPTEEDAWEALDIAARVLDVVCAALPGDVRPKNLADGL